MNHSAAHQFLTLSARALRAYRALRRATATGHPEFADACRRILDDLTRQRRRLRGIGPPERAWVRRQLTSGGLIPCPANAVTAGSRRSSWLRSRAGRGMG